MSRFGDKSVWALLIRENIKISPSIWIQAEQQEKSDEKGHYMFEKDQDAVANSPETASGVTSA